MTDLNLPSGSRQGRLLLDPFMCSFDQCFFVVLVTPEFGFSVVLEVVQSLSFPKKKISTQLIKINFNSNYYHNNYNSIYYYSK